MKRKKLKTFIFALAAVLLIPTSAFASGDPSGWQVVGWQYGLTIYPDYEVTSKEFQSGGGNVELCVYGLKDYNSFTAEVWEEDTSTEQWVTTIGIGPGTLGQGCITIGGISGYTDGDNGKAELVFKFNYAQQVDTVDIRVRD